MDCRTVDVLDEVALDVAHVPPVRLELELEAERREEALGDGVVPAVPLAAHALHGAVCRRGRAVGLGTRARSHGRWMDQQPRARLAPRKRTPQRLDGDPNGPGRGDRPATSRRPCARTGRGSPRGTRTRSGCGGRSGPRPRPGSAPWCRTLGRRRWARWASRVSTGSCIRNVVGAGRGPLPSTGLRACAPPGGRRRAARRGPAGYRSDHGSPGSGAHVDQQDPSARDLVDGGRSFHA